MLKKPASFSSARRANLARQARSGVRSSGFEVPKTSNFGPRTSVVSPFPPVSRVSCRYLAGVLSCCATRADHRSSNVPNIVFRQPASASCLSPSNIGEPTAIHRFSVLTQTKRVLNPLVFFSPPTSCVPLASCRIVLKPAKGLLRRSHPQHPPAKTCRC